MVARGKETIGGIVGPPGPENQGGCFVCGAPKRAEVQVDLAAFAAVLPNVVRVGHYQCALVLSEWASRDAFGESVAVPTLPLRAHADILAIAWQKVEDEIACEGFSVKLTDLGYTWLER